MHRPSASRLSRRMLLALAPLLLVLELPGSMELWRRPDSGMSLRGTEIVSVRADGPADEAGVLPKDVLLSLNGQNTPGYASYQAASFGLHAGDEAVLEATPPVQGSEAEAEDGRAQYREEISRLPRHVHGAPLRFPRLHHVLASRRCSGKALLRDLYSLRVPLARPSDLSLDLDHAARGVAQERIGPSASCRLFALFPDLSRGRRDRGTFAPSLAPGSSSDSRALPSLHQ